MLYGLLWKKKIKIFKNFKIFNTKIKKKYLMIFLIVIKIIKKDKKINKKEMKIQINFL